MILAEQGATVEKWTNGKDPILGCRSGQELWAWINYGKKLVNRPVASLPVDPPSVDVVIDNFRPSTLAGWGGQSKSSCRTVRLGMGIHAKRGWRAIV
jgi:hypothetical protein